MKAISKAGKVIYAGLGQFFANPDIAALSQAHPVSAMISQYLGGNYAQEQFETLTDFVHLLHSRLHSVETRKIDKEFLEAKDGKRIIGKIFKAILRDNRSEKLQAMANLTSNISLKSKLNIDEKELYVEILDGLNSLQLSILQKAVVNMRARTTNQHRGFGWELMMKDYEQKGVSKPLLLQSIRTLESNGLVNENRAQIGSPDTTHFLTDFGEQFYDFISDQVKEESPYLLPQI